MIEFSPAPVTPMDKNGNIAYEEIEIYVRTLERNKISTIFLNGSTGEYNTLTIPERQKIVETWLKNASPQFRIILNVTAQTEQDTIQLTVHAKETGVFGIAARVPEELKKKGLNSIVKYFQRISSNAKDVPFYYYHLPFKSQNYSILEFIKSAQKSIPDFHGVKYVKPDLVDFDLCNRNFGKNLELFYCKDENVLGAMVMGIEHAMGTNYNFLIPLYNKLRFAYEMKDYNKALELQRKAIDVVDLVRQTKYWHAATRYLMQKAGLKCGVARPPIKQLSTENKKFIDEFLDNNGIMKYLTQYE